MTATAAQTQYRKEFVSGFEQRMSLLRQSVTKEAVIKGNQATFLVADSGSATAQTRGNNGKIPARSDTLTQPTATLVEKHDLVQRTGFDVFASQGDGRRIMQETSMGVINRDIDQTILTELATASQSTGAAATASLTLVLRAKTILGNNEVPFDNNISAVVSPAFHAYLMQIDEFASADFVNNKPFTSEQQMFRWVGVNWIVHPNLPGKGTNAEQCFMYHASAVGHACNIDELQSEIGFNAEQQYSWARTSIFMGAKLLQNAGVVTMAHDGSALVAA